MGIESTKTMLNNVNGLTTINFIDVVGLRLKLSLMYPAVLQYCRGSITFQMLKYLGKRGLNYEPISPCSLTVPCLKILLLNTLFIEY